jgi:hypothetical protein
MALSMFFFASLLSSAGEATSFEPEAEDIPLVRRDGFMAIVKVGSAVLEASYVMNVVKALRS